MLKIGIPTLALLGSALLVASCRHEGAGTEPNPCQTAQANPLRFRFLESFGTPTPDTAYVKQDITFEGPGAPYTSYEWRIGNDPRVFTQQKLSLYFPEATNGTYAVRLIARRPLNTACFPKDDGIDTLTRELTLVPLFTAKPPTYGRFLGSNTDAPRDTFSIRLFQGLDPYNAGSPIFYDFLANLGRGCRSPYFTIGRTWRGLNFSYGGNDYSCLTEAGAGYLPTRDSIVVTYSQFESGTSLKRVNRVFKGRRVR